MLPTFVIGLREGVEASLIVGIVAAFLSHEGRRDALRWMWAGVALATGICVAGGVALWVVSRSLPQREQEALETVIGGVAVAAVTFMIVWMRRNARGLRRALEGRASNALAKGSVVALVGMAFFAIIREGFETSVFLLAAFDSSSNPGAAGGGALLGVLVAIAIGYGIYRGGIRLNLARFFRATGFVLVLVAAGLVATALHTAHEAGWLNDLQTQAFDLRWLVAPGSVRAALLTGILGFQPRPVLAEALGYLVYAAPMAIYVLWPSDLRIRRRHRSPQSLAAGRAA
ncbi:MAG TPA: iron uptake transporter permease EfeU [Gaiellaceae bacterium]|nr:iron uptake transporter permease EfeU [Gaiellaceae bacterium]